MAKDVLAVDCDGVVADFHTPVVRFINAALGTKFTVNEWTEYDIECCFGEGAERVLKEIMRLPEFWRILPVHQEVVDGLRRLADRYELVMISLTPHHARDQRREWLRSLDLPISRYIPCDSKLDKVLAATDAGAVAFVEDSSEVASVLVMANIPTLIVRRPWVKNVPGAIIGDWPELEERLLTGRFSLVTGRFSLAE